MDISPLQIVTVLLSGVAAGFINTLAGGGSFISLVALKAILDDTNIANGTNRIAVEIGAIMSTLGFRSKGISDTRMAMHFAIPALLGAIVGAQVTANMDEQLLDRVIGVAMLMMLGTLLLDSKKWVKPQQVELTPKRRALIYLAFFGIGIYGGAIQAGVGFLLTAAIVMLAGQDLVRTSYFKAVIVAVYTTAALAIFIYNGQVNWVLGLILSVGNGAGSWLASRLAVNRGAKFVRGVLIAVLLVVSVQSLGLIPGL